MVVDPKKILSRSTLKFFSDSILLNEKEQNVSTFYSNVQYQWQIKEDTSAAQRAKNIKESKINRSTANQFQGLCLKLYDTNIFEDTVTVKLIELMGVIDEA